MALYDPENSAEQNLEILAGISYPGRLLVVGFSGDLAVQAYAVEGRSEGSRNRILVEDNPGIISTEIADTTLPVGDPELTIYDAMRRVKDLHVVSNGNQTDRVTQFRRTGKTFLDAMEKTDHEPDSPNFTPRISGFHLIHPYDGEARVGISVISKSQLWERSIRRSYTDKSGHLDFGDGTDDVGYAVHTYQGDATPLPSFDEPPFKIPILGSADEMANMLWDNLDEANRVAVVAKTIPLDGGKVEHQYINTHG